MISILSPLGESLRQGLSQPVVVHLVGDSGSNIDWAQSRVFLDGRTAVAAGGLAQAGFSLSAAPGEPGVVNTATTWKATITPTDPWPRKSVYTSIALFSSNGAEENEASHFTTEAGAVTNLTATSWYHGEQINLSWDTDSAVERVLIRRSSMNYCRFDDDEGTTIYEGAPIASLEDAGLQPGQLYYYTIFCAYSVTDVAWHYTEQACVAGLSLKNYNALYGSYVYSLMPREIRRQDQANGGMLEKYCDIVQAQVNLHRSWAEAVTGMRDPDVLPAGQIGVAEHQTGILEAQASDLGIVAEKAFDGASLRRVVAGIASVVESKGTCPSLEALVKIVTGWDSSCDAMNLSQCGVDRVFRAWDGESRYYLVEGTLGAGSISAISSRKDAAGEIVADLPAWVYPERAFVLDAYGTFTCVESISNTMITFVDAEATLRDRIEGVGLVSENAITITDIDVGSYPWQFPDADGFARPSFGLNAWAGYKVRIGAVNYTIVSSSETDSYGNTLLTLLTDPEPLSPGAQGFTLAKDFTGATPVAQPLRLYVGDFSLSYDPKWDSRLREEGSRGPWSFVPGNGGTPLNPFYAPSPQDFTMWVDGQYAARGVVTRVYNLALQDSNRVWTANEWAGYYVLPNWNQRSIYRVLANTSDTLYVAPAQDGGQPLEAAASAGSRYVLLDHRNALYYARLSSLFPRYTPRKYQGFIKFRPVTPEPELPIVYYAVAGPGGGPTHVYGSGFAPGSIVYVDGVPVTTTFNDSGDLTFEAPPGADGTFADLLVIVGDVTTGESGKQKLRYINVGDPPLLTAVSPSTTAGGNTIWAGDFLTPDVVAYIDGVAATTTYNGVDELEVVVPPGLAPGSYDVSVVQASGTFTLPSGLVITSAYINLAARTASIFLVADDYGPDPGKLQGRASAGGSGGRHYRRDMWVSDTGGSAGYGNTNPTTVTHGGKQWLRAVGTSAGSLHTQMGGGGTSINFNTCFGKVAWTATIACKHDVLGPGPAGNPVASANIIGGFTYNGVFIGGTPGGLRFCALNNANSDWQPIYLPGAGALGGYGVIQMRFRAYNGPGDAGPDDVGELAMRWIPEGADPSTVSWVAIPPNGLFDTGASPVAIAGVCANPATGWQGEWHTIFVEQVYEDNTTADDVAAAVINLAGLSMTPPVDPATLSLAGYWEQGRGTDYDPAAVVATALWPGVPSLGSSGSRPLGTPNTGAGWTKPTLVSNPGGAQPLLYDSVVDELVANLTLASFATSSAFCWTMLIRISSSSGSVATRLFDAVFAVATAGKSGSTGEVSFTCSSISVNRTATITGLPLDTWFSVFGRFDGSAVSLQVDESAPVVTTGAALALVTSSTVRGCNDANGSALSQRLAWIMTPTLTDAERNITRAWWQYVIGLR